MPWTRLDTLFERWKPYRFTILLGFLMLNFVTSPILSVVLPSEEYPLGRILILISFIGVLAGTILAVEGRPGPTWTVLGLAVLVVIFNILDIALAYKLGLKLTHLALEIAFLGCVASLVLRHLLHEKRVSGDLISAALCTYMIVGLAFASLYVALEALIPGGFAFPDDGIPAIERAKSSFERNSRAVYYSFVTLLTLGYGDIYPIAVGPRFIAVLEALFGQVFLVVLVARLVGLHVAQSTSD